MAARILVADDHLPILEVLSHALTLAGYDARPVADGTAARVALEREWPDLLIADLLMPGVSGLDLARWVRAREGADGQLPIILLSAALPSGLQPPLPGLTVVPKPFDLSALLDLIERLLRDRATPDVAGSVHAPAGEGAARTLAQAEREATHLVEQLRRQGDPERRIVFVMEGCDCPDQGGAAAPYHVHPCTEHQLRELQSAHPAAKTVRAYTP